MAAGNQTNPHFLLTKEEKEKLRGQIQEIESKAHTKIAVQIVRDHSGDLYEKAVQEFSKLQLHHEKIKTGVLILISLKPRRFQILGDQHIHEKIGEEGWKSMASQLTNYFKEDKFYEGLMRILNKLEGFLATHFHRVWA